MSRLGGKALGYGPHVLVVVTDPELLDLLVTPLDLAGWHVRSTGTGAGAWALLGTHRFDLIIVDEDIPDIEVVARGRRPAPGDRPPVLCLSSCDALERLMPELGFGIEDYVTKPCRITEVLARARVLLGRQPAQRTGPLGLADLLLDEASGRAWRGDRPLELTPAEHRLLRHLLVNAEQVLSKEQLAWQVWGEARGDNAIERLVSRLRRKVDEDGPELIHTRRGFGYWVGVT